MKNAIKIDLLSLRKLNNQLAEWSDRDGLWDNPHTLEIEHTYFASPVGNGSGLNGAHNLVRLETEIYEAKNVFLDRSSYNYLNLYIQTKYRLGDRQCVLYVMKNSKGKRITQVFNADRGDSSDAIGPLRILLGWELPEKTREETETIYTEALDNICYDGRKQLNDLLTNAGFKISNQILFNRDFCFKLSAGSATEKELNFLYHTFGTYCSHPEKITIKLKRELKSINLHDLGLETNGYYSHCNRMAITPNQLNDVLKFKKKFNSIKNKYAVETK